MKTILITGSSGLIGSALCKQYNSEEVQLCDLKSGQDFRYINIDNNVKTVFHLAAVSRVIDADLQPEYTSLINQLSIPDFIKKCGVGRKIILASSKEVFGDSLSEVHEYSSTNPKSHYGSTKNEMEKIANEFFNLGYDISVIRFSTVFGSIADHRTRVFPLFINRALDDLTLDVIGENKLIFPTYVKAVSAELKRYSLQKEFHNNKMPIRNYVANGITLVNLAKLVITLCNSKSKINIINKDTNYASCPLRSDYMGAALMNWETSLKNYIDNHRK